MNKNRIISLALAVVLLVALALPAFASGYDTEDIGGTKSFTFAKYLLFNKDVQSLPDDLTITFTIAPGVAVPEQSILAGVEHTFASASITISNSDLKEAKSYSVEEVAGKAGLSSMTADQKYIKKDVTISFDGIAFPAPGNYAYTITETPTGKGYMSDDTDSAKDLIVAVENDPDSGENKLKIASYYLSTSPTDGKKTDGFTNTYVTNSLTVSNTVLGNQANLDLYFKYTVTLGNCVDGTYTVNLDNAEASPDTTQEGVSGQKNDSTITVDAQNGQATFYLKNKQSITIENLPKGAAYTVVQEEIADYTVDPTSKQYEGTIEDSAVNAAFQNTKNGVVPTGVMLVIAPFVVLTVVGGVGAFAIARKRSKDTEEE